jgi:hypothetical protein
MNAAQDSNALSSNNLSPGSRKVYWTPAMEIQLFHALAKYKPVGVYYSQTVNLEIKFFRKESISTLG